MSYLVPILRRRGFTNPRLRDASAAPVVVRSEEDPQCQTLAFRNCQSVEPEPGEHRPSARSSRRRKNGSCNRRHLPRERKWRNGCATCCSKMLGRTDSLTEEMASCSPKLWVSSYS